MANHKSAAKRARQSIRKTSRNSRIKSTVRTFEKGLRKAISEKKMDEAKKLMISFSSEIDKAAQKGIVHANNAARKVSRLAKQVQSLG